MIKQQFTENRSLILVLAIMGFIIISSCRNRKADENIETAEKPSIEVLHDSLNDVDLLKIHNRVFMIPSPYQVVQFIEKNKVEFRKDLANDPANSEMYPGNFKKCINFGIYSIDLAYSNIFGDKKGVAAYLEILKKYGRDLGIENALSSDLLEIFERNNFHPDTLSALLPETIKQIDNYLKESDRSYQSVLILTGSWTESFYLFVNNVDLEDETQLERIAYQKYVVGNLLKVLEPYRSNSSEMEDLYLNLSQFLRTFDEITLNYRFESVEDDEFHNLTEINSETDVQISEPVLKNIVEGINEIRQRMTKM